MFGGRYNTEEEEREVQYRGGGAGLGGCSGGCSGGDSSVSGLRLYVGVSVCAGQCVCVCVCV